MSTLTKLALGMMGQLKPLPVPTSDNPVVLPSPNCSGGMGLMDALQRRQSQREFSAAPLELQTLSNLLWAAAGINRPALGGRTAPSAMNSQEVQLFVALPQGLSSYEPVGHRLQTRVLSDIRRVTGYQDFVDTAALDLIYVADHRRMSLVPAAQRDGYAFAAAGAMSQNVYLFCAAHGLSTVIRAWFDHQALSAAMGLEPDHHLLLCQTVGTPRKATSAGEPPG
jgi:nitroreductase